MLLALIAGLSLLLLLITPGEAVAAVAITVNKATQRMTVAVDGKVQHSWPVSTGTKGYATPTGSFRPFRLAKEHYSNEWDDAAMPHSIFFTGRGHAIHGTNAVRRLGSPASHGCVRLAPSKAAKLFALVQSEGLANTKIVVTGSEAPQVAKRRGDRARTARYRRDPDEFRRHDVYFTQPYYVQSW
jgi:lipoprotein-anchoring transpeptidase ErfK/SrfK